MTEYPGGVGGNSDAPPNSKFDNSEGSAVELVGAHDVGWIDLDVKKFSHSLREFRNLVHPHEQWVTRSCSDKDKYNIIWPVVAIRALNHLI